MGKHRSYIRHWRKFRALTQREVIERLGEIKNRENSREKFPTTEASLSRVEQGSQNFNMALLAALAEVFEVEDPRDLLVVNPFAGTLGVMRAIEGLTQSRAEAALKVIEAMRSVEPKEIEHELD